MATYTSIATFNATTGLNTVSDTWANIQAALSNSSSVLYTKASLLGAGSITCTDSSAPAEGWVATLTSTQYTNVFTAKFVNFTTLVTGITVVNAVTAQNDPKVASFTVSDSSAAIAGALNVLQVAVTNNKLTRRLSENKSGLKAILLSSGKF